MFTLTVKFYETSNGKRQASILDNGTLLYMTAQEARVYLKGKHYAEGHENNSAQFPRNSHSKQQQ